MSDTELAACVPGTGLTARVRGSGTRVPISSMNVRPDSRHLSQLPLFLAPLAEDDDGDRRALRRRLAQQRFLVVARGSQVVAKTFLQLDHRQERRVDRKASEAPVPLSEVS